MKRPITETPRDSSLSLKHLGARSSYPESYDPSLLEAIPRRRSVDRPAVHGFDRWRAYECVLHHGIKGAPPLPLVIEISYSSESRAIIESKSMKLYLHGVAWRRFESLAELVSVVGDDIAAAVGERPTVTPLTPREWDLLVPERALGISLDVATNTPTTPSDKVGPLCFSTDSLWSRCPITGQPDWASILFEITGPLPPRHELASLLQSLSGHEGFHEDATETIFAALTEQFSPQELAVVALFTRRGGIEITPVRHTEGAQPFVPVRTWRQ